MKISEEQVKRMAEADDIERVMCSQTNARLMARELLAARKVVEAVGKVVVAGPDSRFIGGARLGVALAAYDKATK